MGFLVILAANIWPIIIETSQIRLTPTVNVGSRTIQGPGPITNPSPKQTAQIQVSSQDCYFWD